ncbi:hypothetical protein HMPREF3145_03200 [Corynebacterium sp. HMSC05C01]|nr:hypothetical protein HMPREF3145_03200 [Corynebacterium sp. HMSC05C01]
MLRRAVSAGAKKSADTALQMMMQAGRLGIRQRESDGLVGRGGKCVAVHHEENPSTDMLSLCKNS